MKTEQGEVIIDEEVRKEIYTAAHEYATGQIDPRDSKHHFVSGAVWALGNTLIQNFLDQEKPASLIDRIKVDYDLILKLYRRIEFQEDSGFVDEIRLEIVKIQNTLRQLKVQFH